MAAAALLLAALIAQAPAPTLASGLPDGNALVRSLVGAQKRHEEALDRYTYDVLEVREDLDGKDRVTKRRSRLYQVFYVKGRPVRKLVAEDDQPLTVEREAKESRAVAAKVQEILEGGTVSERPGVRLSLILERFDFRSVAREDVNGRQALALDFAPLPGKRDLDSDALLRRMTGRIWVDEEERQVVRAHLTNTGSIKFALGIGANVSEVVLDMQFRKLEDGVWLPLETRGLFAGRKLFKSFRTRHTTTYDRYRRFEVQSEEHVAPKP